MASRRCLSEAVALTRSLDASSSFFSSALTASLAPLFFALATSAASLLSEASSALASESVCCSSRWRAKSPACSSSTFLCTYSGAAARRGGRRGGAARPGPSPRLLCVVELVGLAEADEGLVLRREGRILEVLGALRAELVEPRRDVVVDELRDGGGSAAAASAWERGGGERRGRGERGRGGLTRLISSSLVSFFSMILIDCCFLSSNIRVPAASSIMPSVSAGFMLSTFVIRPCMMRKCGLLTLRPTEWKRFCTRCSCAFWPLIRYLFRPPMATCAQPAAGLEPAGGRAGWGGLDWAGRAGGGAPGA